MANNIPVLSIGFGEPKPEFQQALLDAAHNVGFFYLADHGIPDMVIESVLDTARKFFALPDADKLAIEMVKSPHFRGYNRSGAELTKGKPDWREQIDIGAELPPLPQGAATPAWDRLQGPNQWPAALPELEHIMLDYQRRVTTLAIRLLRAFCVSLGQRADALESIYTPRPTQLLKLLHYPGRHLNGGGQGVGEHKDFGFLTILLQDGVNNGLQVKDKTTGEWIDAPPIPGTFVVNIGEVLEMATNGYLLANIHRAVSPPAGHDRISIPFFLEAKFDAIVPVLELPPELAAQSAGVTADPQNPLFREVGRNYLKGRLRSHPDVAKRHYPDLI